MTADQSTTLSRSSTNASVVSIDQSVGNVATNGTVTVNLPVNLPGTSVALAWNPNQEPVTGYRVSYGTTSGQYTNTIGVGNTTSYTVTNLLSGSTYYFAVQAYNAAGTGPYSSEVSATLASPLTVTNLTANRTSPQPAGTTITFSATASGGTPPYQYKWWIVNGTTQTVGSNWSTNSSFAWTPTSANPNYTIRVWARNLSSTADAPDNPAATREMSFAITAPGGGDESGAHGERRRRQNHHAAEQRHDERHRVRRRLACGSSLTRSWTRVSGPGTVTFSAPTSATTSASFSAAGAYVLRLTVSDGALSASDDVAVTVNAPASGSLAGAWGFNEGGWNEPSATVPATGDRERWPMAPHGRPGRHGQALNFDGADDLHDTGQIST